MQGWDKEYVRKGIPSSYLDEPSGVLVWALANWTFVARTTQPRTAIDIGCGTGRNARYLVQSGIRVVALDSSREALRQAGNRGGGVEYVLRDLRHGLPGADGEFDLALDIFVSKHLLDAAERLALRREQARVLAPAGRLLLSLARPEDGYYAACPDFPGREGERPRVVVDPHTGIGSALLTLEDLREEMRANFELEMAWEKSAPGPMHGGVYPRRTLATLWRRWPSPVR